MNTAPTFDVPAYNETDNDALSTELSHFVLDHADHEHSVQLIGEIDEYHTHVLRAESELHQLLVPALESDGQTIARENFIDTLGEYWQKFLAFLKQLWEKIVQFCMLHFTILGRRQLYVKRMIKQVKSLSTNPEVYQRLQKQGDFTIDETAAKYFCFEGHYCSNFGELQHALAKTGEVVTFLTGDYPKRVIACGAKIENAIRSATVENANETMQQLKGELTRIGYHRIDAGMLGDVRVRSGYTENEQGEDAKLTGRQVVFTQGDAKITGASFKPMTIEELARIFTSMDLMLAQIDTFKGGLYKEVVQHSSSMISATDKFVNIVTSYLKSNKSEDGQPGNATTYREIMGLNRQYLSWVKVPLTDLITNLTAICHGVSTGMEKNIQMYAPEPAQNLFTVIGIV
ncbi:hypothetical protein [Paraburkholderia sp. BCC1886]|uniref:hypothetical protein n=1 Tax=Paraburkholderia sp. BCC1886 TaxID=2562670 RepID=UPI00118360C9|nr:hypothetical protein [Paraburkholderia sp. BCC1886]